MTLSEMIEAVSMTEGWLGGDEWRALLDASLALPDSSRILEIGSYKGKSTLCLALPQVGRGLVTCVDPFIGAGLGAGSAWFSTIHAYSLESTVSLFKMTSDAAFHYILEAGDMFDLAFVDGCHEYNQCKRDLENCIACLNNGGRIFMHDYHKDWAGCVRAWDEIGCRLSDHNRHGDMVDGALRYDKQINQES